MIQCSTKNIFLISRKIGVAKRCVHKVSLQLDYYMSPQFAGIAVALSNNLYKSSGIELKFLPICAVGNEMAAVRNNVKNNGGSSASEISIGSVEQNIFIPTLQAYPCLGMKAVAAMFRRSPLCLASLTDSSVSDMLTEGNDHKNKRITVGVHEDSVSVIERVLEADKQNLFSVMASPRSTKVTDLLQGKYDCVQAYLTTEVPTLQRQISSVSSKSTVAVDAKPLEGMNGAKLGYSQVIFCPEEDLVKGKDTYDVIKSFLDVTFRGWEEAIRDPESAARSVDECRLMLKLDDERNDHWHPSFDYTVQSVGLCGNFVKETFQGDRLGVINAERWNEATNWLLGNDDEKIYTEKSFGLDDTNMWQPSRQIMGGNELARKTLEKAAESSRTFNVKYGRKPSLAVITVGQLPRYTHGEMRLQLYSNQENSWFSKTSVGEANGFDVKEISLPSSTTTDELLSRIYSLSDVDAIQLMWPMPPQIDAAKAYSVISPDRDVDGAHYIGQVELGISPLHRSPPFPLPPVTPMSVIALMDEYKVEIKNKSILVIGRSRIVGSPIAHMLRERGAIVTSAHSEVPTDKLESLVRSSDIVVSCAGSPNLIKAEWVKMGADVINVGSTFSDQEYALLSDIDGDLAPVANRFSPVPGGVGPLSIAFLLQNVAAAAWERATNVSDVEMCWSRKSGCLQRSFHFKSYNSALAFANKVNSLSSDIDHHANMTFSHKCVNGVDLDIEFFTFEANKVTDKDYKAARGVNLIWDNNLSKSLMKNFTYDLNPNSIAKYPASPRGSSRLLRVNEEGEISHYENFAESFFSLVKGAHVVFNKSKVVNARLSIVETESDNVGKEMMLLDLGECLNETCDATLLTVMVRKEDVKIGDIFIEETLKEGKFKVADIIGPWIEDEKSNGNGTECVVQCSIHDKSVTLANFLEKVGSVPIPPYLSRDVEDSDALAYNNVFASGDGSVAAPTAGLHFTNELLSKIGHKNISYLALHVGAGTFKPVVTEDAQDHTMHSENFVVDIGEIKRIIQCLENKRRLIVVGTTSARTLESLYWIGLKILRDSEIKNEASLHATSTDIVLGQNEWVHLEKLDAGTSAVDALRAVVDDNEGRGTVSGRTSLMIVGDYDFKVVNDLVTNFHAPDSTLMLLVSSFLGSSEKVRTIYAEAEKKGYKFLSYGDACFFTKGSK